MKLRAYVGTLRASNGTTYVVAIEHEEDKYKSVLDKTQMTPYQFNDRYKAEYEAATWNAFFAREEGPYILDYTPEKYPNETNRH